MLKSRSLYSVTGLVLAMSLIFSACMKGPRKSPLDSEKSTASFFPSALSGEALSNNQGNKSDLFKVWGIPSSRIFNFDVCLKDNARQQPIIGARFKIDAFPTPQELRSDANGCLHWAESFDFGFLEPPAFFSLTRHITGLGPHRGQLTLNLAINPWKLGTDAVVDLDKKKVPTLIGEEKQLSNEGNQFYQKLTTEEENDFSAQIWLDSAIVHLRSLGQSKNNKPLLELRVEIKPKIRLYNSDQEPILYDLLKGRFNLHLDLVNLVDDTGQGSLRYRLHKELGPLKPNIGKNLITSKTLLELDSIPSRGQLEMALRLIPIKGPSGLKDFSGVFRLGDYQSTLKQGSMTASLTYLDGQVDPSGQQEQFDTNKYFKTLISPKSLTSNLNSQIWIKGFNVGLESGELNSNGMTGILRLRALEVFQKSRSINNDFSLSKIEWGQYTIKPFIISRQAGQKPIVFHNDIPAQRITINAGTFSGSFKNIIFPIRSTDGELEVLIQVEPVKGKAPPLLEGFEGRYILGKYKPFDRHKQVFTENGLDSTFSIKNYLAGKTSLKKGSQKTLLADGFIDVGYNITDLKIRWAGVETESETTTQRTVLLEIETCINNPFTDLSVENQEFYVHKMSPEAIDKIGKSEGRIKTLVKTDPKGCIKFRDKLRHKIFDIERFYKKWIIIEAKKTGLKAEIPMYLNPWDPTFTLGYDGRIPESELPEKYVKAKNRISQRGLVKPQFILRTFYTEFNDMDYRADDYLNLSVIRRYNIYLIPEVTRHDSVLQGRWGNSRLRDGNYYLRLTLLKRSENNTLEQDFMNRQYPTSLFLDSFEKLVRVSSGKISENIEFKIRDLKTIGSRNTLIIELLPLNDDLLGMQYRSQEKLVLPSGMKPADLIDWDSGLEHKLFAGPLVPLNEYSSGMLPFSRLANDKIRAKIEVKGETNFNPDKPLNAEVIDRDLALKGPGCDQTKSTSRKKDFSPCIETINKEEIKSYTLEKSAIGNFVKQSRAVYDKAFTAFKNIYTVKGYSDINNLTLVELAKKSSQEDAADLGLDKEIFTELAKNGLLQLETNKTYQDSVVHTLKGLCRKAYLENLGFGELTKAEFDSRPGNDTKSNSNIKQKLASRSAYKKVAGPNNTFTLVPIMDSLNPLKQTIPDDQSDLYNEGYKNFQNCLAAPEEYFTLDHKIHTYRVQDKNLTKLGGISQNYNVTKNFEVTTSNLLGSTLAENNTAGVGVSANPLAFLKKIPFIGAFLSAVSITADARKGWESSLSDSTFEGDGNTVSFTKSLFLIEQQAAFNIEITRYQPCVSILPDEKKLRSSFNSKLLDNLKDSKEYDQSPQTMSLGWHICAEEQSEPITILEHYYLFSQHFAFGELLDPRQILNRPFILGLRGYREYMLFLKHTQGLINQRDTVDETKSNPKLMFTEGLKLFENNRPFFPGAYTATSKRTQLEFLIKNNLGSEVKDAFGTLIKNNLPFIRKPIRRLESDNKD